MFTIYWKPLQTGSSCFYTHKVIFKKLQTAPSSASLLIASFCNEKSGWSIGCFTIETIKDAFISLISFLPYKLFNSFEKMCISSSFSLPVYILSLGAKSVCSTKIHKLCLQHNCSLYSIVVKTTAFPVQDTESFANRSIWNLEKCVS